MAEIIIHAILVIASIVLIVLNFMKITPYAVTSAAIWLILTICNIISTKNFFKYGKKTAGIIYLIMTIISAVFFVIGVVKCF